MIFRGIHARPGLSVQRASQEDRLPVFGYGLSGVLLEDAVEVFSRIMELSGQMLSGAAAMVCLPLPSSML